MATFTFHSTGYDIGSSGIGFFGSAGFGSSVSVGLYNDSTYITNSNGTIAGPSLNNIKYSHPQSGIVNGLASPSGLLLTRITNAQSTLNIRFSHATGVITQNAKLRIYDRSNINNPASGVTTKIAEIIHPSTSNSVVGSGSATWVTPGGSGTILSLANSPGMSGFSPSGSGTVSDRHDWYLALSSSPDSIGSKTQYAMWVELEYL
jgi:hypothetical protein